jgi:ATP-dependent Clp protease ATP-binding subunit ClpA
MRLVPTRRKSRIVGPADRYLQLGSDQARRLGQAYVGSEHVLLALASEPAGVATLALERLGVTAQLIEAEIRRNPGAAPPTAIDSRALATLGIDLGTVRARIDEQFGEGALEASNRGCRPIEASLKRALAHAIDEAGRQTPGDEHILGGLAAVEDSHGARVLRRLGVTEDALRRALHEV